VPLTLLCPFRAKVTRLYFLLPFTNTLQADSFVFTWHYLKEGDGKEEIEKSQAKRKKPNSCIIYCLFPVFNDSNRYKPSEPNTPPPSVSSEPDWYVREAIDKADCEKDYRVLEPVNKSCFRS
jgi:hypothetical protein